MDAPQVVTQVPNGYEVYLGAWTNWSHGPTLGATLTLRRRDADLIIAFTAFFIAFVATCAWRIICFALHRSYSTVKPQDRVYHQHQAILRNSASAEDGLRLLLSLFWTSRRLRKQSTHVISMAMLAVFCICGFAVLGGFSSRLSDAAGSEVLIKSHNCGYQDASLAEGFNQAFVPYIADKIQNDVTHVHQCYLDKSAGQSSCGSFVADHLAATIDGDAPCPFSEEICRSDNANLRIDSGFIDSHRHLGLNAPPEQRVAWRKVLSCAPILTDGYTSQVNTSVGTSTRYHYGRVGDVNSTTDFIYSAQALDTFYSHEESSLVTRNHLVGCAGSLVQDGETFETAAFTPIDALKRDDADLYVLFLSGNGVIYTNPSNDDWYRTDPVAWDEEVIGQVDLPPLRFYRPLEPASALACAQQYQFCNAALEGTSGCGPLASMRDAIAGVAPLFETNYTNLVNNVAETDTAARFSYFMNMFFSSVWNLDGVIGSLGPASLHSQRTLSGSIQGTLAPKQWHLDITRLWNITLASTQSAMVSTVYGPSDPALLDIWYNYTTPALQRLCGTQKVRSTTYTSMNLFGICFTYALGTLIALASYLLQPVSALLHRKRGFRRYAHLEWMSNSTLQLQRLAHEELGLGTWSDGIKEIPTTQPGEVIGCLDITDSQHPVLRRVVAAGDSNAKNNNLESGSETGRPSEKCEEEEETSESNSSVISNGKATELQGGKAISESGSGSSDRLEIH